MAEAPTTAGDTLVAAAEKVLADVQGGAFTKYTTGKGDDGVGFKWQHPTQYRTDCSGLVCELLRSSPDHRLKRAYHQLMDWALSDAALSSYPLSRQGRPNSDRPYPDATRHLIYASNLYAFAKSSGSANLGAVWEGSPSCRVRGTSYAPTAAGGWLQLSSMRNGDIVVHIGSAGATGHCWILLEKEAGGLDGRGSVGWWVAESTTGDPNGVQKSKYMFNDKDGSAAVGSVWPTGLKANKPTTSSDWHDVRLLRLND
jgi:hypothetical protein